MDISEIWHFTCIVTANVYKHTVQLVDFTLLHIRLDLLNHNFRVFVSCSNDRTANANVALSSRKDFFFLFLTARLFANICSLADKR